MFPLLGRAVLRCLVQVEWTELLEVKCIPCACLCVLAFSAEPQIATVECNVTMATRLCLLVCMVVLVRTTWKVGHVHVADDEGISIVSTCVCFLTVFSCESLPFSCCCY